MMANNYEALRDPVLSSLHILIYEASKQPYEVGTINIHFISDEETKAPRA